MMSEGMEGIIEAHLKSLNADPYDITAIVSLEEIYLQQKRWDDLVALYKKEADSIINPLYSSFIHCRIADIYSKSLYDDSSAITELKKALELNSQNTEALKRLRELCMKAGEWQESLALLQTEAESAPSSEERAEAFLRIGFIFLEKMHDPAKGIEEIEKALALNPKNITISETLEKAYEKESRWENLASFLENKASSNKDPKEAAALLYRTGRIWMEKVSDTKKALSSFGNALSLDPTHLETLKSLKEILVLERQWNDLPDILDREAELLKNSVEAHSIRFSAGEILKDRLSEPEKAISSFLKVLKTDSHHIESLNAMEDILLQFGRWKEIIPVLERQIEREKDPRQTISLRLRIGLIWKNRLGNPDKAIFCFLKVLELDPINRVALHALADTLSQNRRWEELVPVLEKLAETSQDPQEFIDIYTRIAQVFDNNLKDSKKAIESYQRVLTKEQTHLPTLKALEEICLREKDWKGLVRVVEKEAEVFQNPKMAMTMYLWAGEIYNTRLSDIEGAISSYTKALAFSPNDVPTLRSLETLYSLKGAHDESIKAYKKILKATEDPNEQALLYYKIGKIFENSLHQLDEAIENYRKVLSLAPVHLGALSALEGIYREKQNWDELAKIIESRAQAQEDPREVASLFAIQGDIYEHDLHSDEKAIAAYAKSFSLDQDNVQAFEGLKKLYMNREAYSELVQLMEKKEERLTIPEERSALLYRAAVLTEHKLLQEDKAQSLYQHSLELTPAHFPSLLALEQIFIKTKKWEDLIGVYKKELALLADQRRIISLYHKIAEIYENKLSSNNDAIALYGKILDINPADRTALNALYSLYERTENWDGCLQILKLKIRLMEKRGDLIPVYTKSAYINRNILNIPERAKENFDKLLEISPENIDALKALEELHEKAGNWKELLAILHRMTKISKDPTAQAAVLFKTGSVWEEHLGDKNEAILCYQKVLELAPNHFMALRSLERLYSQRERWEDLVKVLSREAELRGGEEQYVSISLRMAEIIETKLIQKDRAEKMYRDILAKDPDNFRALSSLSRLLKVGGKWEELIGIFSKIITIVPTQEEALPIYMEMADICQNKLLNGERALSFFKEALKINPTSLPAFEGMKNIYQKENRWEEMVKVLEEEIMLVADPDKKIILLTEMGKVLDENLGRKKAAVQCYEQVLSLKPDHLPVLEPLANYYVNESIWDKASQCLDKLMSLERDPKKKIGYLSLLGKVCKDGMKDIAKATHYYESALAIDPAHMPSLEALASIYEQNSDFDNLSKTLQRAIDIFTKTDPSKALPFHIKLGELYSTRLKNDDKALAEFQKATKIDPRNLNVHIYLAGIYKKNIQTKNEYMREHIKIIQIDPARTESARIAGNIYEEQKQFDKSYCLFCLVELFGAESKMERLFIDSNRPKLPKKAKKPLDEDLREKLLAHPAERNPVRRFLRALDDQMNSLYPPQIDKYGSLKKLEGFFQNQLPPIQVFQDVIESLGIGPLSIMVSEGAFNGIAVENTSPPSLIVGLRAFEKMTPEECRFLIGRHVEHIGSRFILSKKLSSGESWELMCLMAKALELEAYIPGRNDEYIQKKLKDFKKQITRRNKKLLEEAAREFLNLYKKFDFQAHLRAQNYTADRAGLLTCNDLASALSAIAKTDKRFASLNMKDTNSLKKFLSESQEARELIQFSLSDDYFILRSRLGFSLLSV